MAVLAEPQPALAVKRERGGVQEDQRQVGEEVAPPLEQLLFDLVLHAARRDPLRAGRLDLLAEPRHRSIKVMERQPLGPGDQVILHPGGAVPVRAGHKEAMKGGGEHGALDRKLEPALV